MSGLIPKDQAAHSGGFSFHHNLSRRNSQGFNYRRIAGENPAHRLLHIDHDRLADQDMKSLSFGRSDLLLLCGPEPYGEDYEGKNQAKSSYCREAIHLLSLPSSILLN